MQLQYKLIKVTCPRCGSEKEVPVPNSLFSEKKTGHIKIRVPKGAVCPDHVFIVFIDLQGKIIGYETVDLSLSSLAKFEPREDGTIDNGNMFSLEEFIELIGFQCLAGLLHAKLFDYPSFIILEKEFKVNFDAINNFLDDLMPEKYKNTKFLKTLDYSENTYPTAEYFSVMVNNQKQPAFLINLRKHVVQTPWKTSLELEYSIINSALSKDDQKEQLRFLTFYISKFLKDVDDTIIILDTLKKISTKNLIKKLKEKAITSTITKNYITIIKEFIHRRITTEIAKKIQN